MEVVLAKRKAFDVAKLQVGALRNTDDTSLVRLNLKPAVP